MTIEQKVDFLIRMKQLEMKIDDVNRLKNQACREHRYEEACKHRDEEQRLISDYSAYCVTLKGNFDLFGSEQNPNPKHPVG